MSLVAGRGSEINFNSNVDLKKVYIRLKENGSVRVRVLGLEDYITYKAHSEYNLKVYTQPCPAPNDLPCPLCVASKSGIDGFDKLYVKKRYLFAFADIDTGELRVWDCSYTQAKDMIGQIREYADDIGDIAFNLKRTGNKSETSYKLNPILKLKADDKEKFHMFDDVEVELSFFEACLVPRSEKMMMDILNEAGFPMDDYFPDYVPEGDEQEQGQERETPPCTDDDIPF